MNSLQTINVVLDLYSAVICLVLFVALLVRRSGKNRLRYWFSSMCGINSLMSLADIPNWACEGTAKAWYPAAMWSGSLLFWLCSSLMLLAFTGYLMEYLREKTKVRKNFWHFCLSLSAVHILCCLLSLWNGMFFTITEGNIYVRGPQFVLSQLIPLLIYAADIAIFVINRKKLFRKDFRILTSYIVLPLAAEGIQIFNYGVALLNTGVTISLVLIFINIQFEQELKLERREKELAETRMDIILSQIRPHFLYNSLTVIRQLCGSNPADAKKAIDDFSYFLRTNMDSLKSKAPIPFDQEIRHTESYLNLEKRRHGKRLRIVWDIGVRDFALPPLTLQPIVENAVRYGALSREEGGTVTIITAETSEAYEITVKDDGMGFAFQAKQPPRSGSHMGIKTVRARLAALSRGELTIQSVDGVGTTVIITIAKEDVR